MHPYPDDRALLMVGESTHAADLYYKTRYLVGDPAVFLDTGDDNTLLVLTDFERETAAASGKTTRVHGYKDYGSDELAPGMPAHERTAELALRIVRGERVTRAITNDVMPLFVADYLRANGIDLICDPALLRAPRELKDATEVMAIESAQRATERAMQAAANVIADAHVGHDGLLYDGQVVVTSERLRAVIEASLLEDNCRGEGTITASGAAGAEPHNRGRGPIHAGQPIVIDIFPLHNDLRYYADMTRTISKGTPNHEIVRMYNLTKEALDLALGLIRPGTTGRAVWEAVCRFYEDHGYATFLREAKTPDAGFIHGLGHGVGLEIHEGPQLSRGENVLRENEIITVEPGLYVPGLGGVRIEDLVVVTADGCRNLTVFPKTLVL